MEFLIHVKSLGTVWDTILVSKQEMLSNTVRKYHEIQATERLNDIKQKKKLCLTNTCFLNILLFYLEI